MVHVNVMLQLYKTFLTWRSLNQKCTNRLSFPCTGHSNVKRNFFNAHDTCKRAEDEFVNHRAPVKIICCHVVKITITSKLNRIMFIFILSLISVSYNLQFPPLNNNFTPFETLKFVHERFKHDDAVCACNDTSSYTLVYPMVGYSPTD